MYPKEDIMKQLIFVCLILALGGVLSAQNDPQWLWASGAGGSGADEATRIALDSSGNSYVAGYFTGTADFGGTTLSSAGSMDIFVGKLDPNGIWLWAKRAGGSMADDAYGVCTDNEGNVYVTGYFKSTAQFGSMSLTSNGAEDIFVAKLDTNGNWLWAVGAGGTGFDGGTRLIPDSNGDILVTGAYAGTASFGTLTLTGNTGYNVFVAKLDMYAEWVWVTQAVGSGNMYGNDISTDGGNSYIIGGLNGTLTFGATTLSSTGNWDICLAKLDGDGNWVWVKKAGGTSEDAGYAISTDSNGYSLVTGYFRGFADFGTFHYTSVGDQDIFIARLDPSGNWLWALPAGGTAQDYGGDVYMDNYGNCYAIGCFSLTFELGNHTYTSQGSQDIFIARLDHEGNCLWATSIGGNNVDVGFGIVTDSSGNYYVGGCFTSSVAFGSTWLNSAGGLDIWVGKLSSGTPVDDELAPDLTDVSCLSDAWPNPFRVGTTATVKANIAERETGTLTLFNLRGQIVQSHQLTSGAHQISVDGNGLPAGIYLYQLKTQTVSAVKKLVLLK